MDPRSRPWTIRSTALAVTGVVCFLLYMPTMSPLYIVLGVSFLLASTAAALVANKKGEK